MIAHLWKVAHRGASAEQPENTLAAFRRAIELGADVVEADVRLTADGDPVVLHDATVDRTTTGTGPLAAMTTEAARALDAGAGEHIPLVRDLLELARGQVRVNLDIKELAATAPTAALVAELGMVHSVTFISFLPEVWEALPAVNPGCPVVLLADSAAAMASMMGGDVGTQPSMAGIGVPYALVTDVLVERMHRHGRGVFAWTVDDAGEMRRLIGLGVNGIVTNRIGELVEVERSLRAVS